MGLLNRWESQVFLRQGHKDISQNGNFKNFRNAVFGQEPFVWDPTDWRLPRNDLLSFDYVSLRRPPPNAAPVKEEVWSAILDHIRPLLFKQYVTNVDLFQEIEFSYTHVLGVLWRLSSRFFLTCCQLRELLCVFH